MNNANAALYFAEFSLEQWTKHVTAVNMFPWNNLMAADKAFKAQNDAEGVRLLREVVQAKGLESLQTLVAWRCLREHGIQPDESVARKVYGVIVEIGLQGGYDLLAVYRSKSARYYNYAGGGVVWEPGDGALDDSIEKLMEAAQSVADKIGPWEEPRRPAPGNGTLRLNFLTPAGLLFGEGPTHLLARDAMAGPVFKIATDIFLALTEMAKKKKG